MLCFQALCPWAQRFKENQKDLNHPRWKINALCRIMTTETALQNLWGLGKWSGDLMVRWRDQFYFFNSDEACMIGNCTHCFILIVLLSCRVHSLESFKRTNSTSWYQTSDCPKIYHRILFPVILFYEVVITKVTSLPKLPRGIGRIGERGIEICHWEYSKLSVWLHVI